MRSPGPCSTQPEPAPPLSLKFTSPIVRAVSSVMVRVPVMSLVKLAVEPLPSAMIPPAHLLESLQLPSPSKIHVPSVA